MQIYTKSVGYISRTANAVLSWLRTIKLNLNPDKIEVMLVLEGIIFPAFEGEILKKTFLCLLILYDSLI